ncbi:hypothetical protein K8R43_01545 [archaeon]|nr:hypothetical protein [archaeon]
MNRSKLGDELRKKDGMDVLAKRLLKKVDHSRIVISNFRSPEEVQFFIDRTPKFSLIKIDAEPSTRFKRRGTLDPNTTKEFFERDKRDINNKGMGRVFELADYHIDNNGSLEQLYEQLDVIITKIGLDSESEN